MIAQLAIDRPDPDGERFARIHPGELFIFDGALMFKNYADEASSVLCGEGASYEVIRLRPETRVERVLSVTVKTEGK